MSLRRRIEDIRRGQFDLLVIGGGILGAFVALMGARAGYSVAVLERRDFASGTSSGSGRVIHGGLRYLQRFDIPLMQEAQEEQASIARIAPKLVRPIRFLVPAEKESIPRNARLRVAAWGWRAYRRLAGNDLPLKKSEYLTSETTSQDISWLERIGEPAALAYSDLQLRSPERLVVALLRQAASEGAKIANYAEVTGFEMRGHRVRGVTVRDATNGARFSVASRMVVSAAGAWTPELESQVGGRNLAKTRFARGTHAVLDRPEPDVALALPVVEGGGTSDHHEPSARRVFIMPWEGRTLFGATYSPVGGAPDRCRPDVAEVRGLMETVDEQWPDLALRQSKILYTYSGLYPIFDAQKLSHGGFTASLHPRVVDHQEADGISGLVSAVSVKFTTARALAKQVMRIVDRRLVGSWSGGSTADAIGPLEYAQPTPISGIERVSEKLLDDRDTMERMVAVAAEKEMALTLEDLLFRRTWIGQLGRPDAPWLKQITSWMASRRNWTARRTDRELASLESRYDWRAA